MDKLYNCAKSFSDLLEIKYHIILGRKGMKTHLNIIFSKWDFHHLMGLGKLKDIRISRQNRYDAFNDILNKKITYDKILTSKYFDQIIDRFYPLTHIENILDENNIIFKYNEKQNTFSLIQADFLLSTPFYI